jgi:hypothetical protein
MLVCLFLQKFSYVRPLVSDTVTETVRQLYPCHNAQAASGISVKTGLHRPNSITGQQTAVPWQPVKLLFQMRARAYPKAAGACTNGPDTDLHTWTATS